MSRHILVNHNRQGDVSGLFVPRFPDCLHHPGWFYGTHGYGSIEWGTDFDCSYHTLIPTLWNGIVRYSGLTCWDTRCHSSSGGAVVIDCYVNNLGEESSYYLHLDMSFVKVGQLVRKGDIIGLSGAQVGYGHWPTSSWYTGGPHVEIGFDAPFLFHDRGHNVNPLPYIERAIR